MLFYVRRDTCADGAFEYQVLNGHTRRRASIRERRLQRSGRSYRRSSIWPSQSQKKKPRCDGAGLRQVSNGGGLSSAVPYAAIPGFGFLMGFGQIKPRLDRGDQRGFFYARRLRGVPSCLVNSKHAYSFRKIADLPWIENPMLVKKCILSSIAKNCRRLFSLFELLNFCV